MSFKDHFSGHADQYCSYRPAYPDTLFEFLASQCKKRDLAWDCATGNGQAALGLARHFRQVVATDASAQQIANAMPASNVTYRVAPAEQSGLEAASVDIVTVAQALHWFDLNAFYAEVGRVLKPNGLLAVWCYGLLHSTPEIDEVIGHLYQAIVGPYWPAERVHIDQGYRDLPFPYSELATPDFTFTTEWDLPQLLGYLRTWSAVQRYRQQQGSDPLERIADEIRAAWGPVDQVRTLQWPLSLRCGRHP